MSQIGAERFFSALAPEGVTAMEVQVKGEPKTAKSLAVDAGSYGRLLVVAVSGRMVSSRDPESVREYEIRLLDAGGAVVHAATMSDSGG